MRKLILSVLFGAVIFIGITGCVLFEKPWETEQAWNQTGELEHYGLIAAEDKVVGKWFYFNLEPDWGGAQYFASTPAVVDGWIKVERNENASEDNWRAQILRLLDKSKSEYEIKLKVKASQDVKVPYYFGAEPYMDENTAIRGEIEFKTTEQEITLSFKKQFTNEENLKFALEFGKIPNVTLYVKPVSVKYR